VAQVQSVAQVAHEPVDYHGAQRQQQAERG
jgi:hypothetical protein